MILDTRWQSSARAVFRISPDEYVTTVEGATMTFSSRIVVVELLCHRTPG